MWEQLDFPHRAKTTLTSNCGPLLFPLRRFLPSRCKVFRVLGGAAFPHLAKTAFLAERSFPLRPKRALLFAVQLLSFTRKRHSAWGCAWFRWKWAQEGMRGRGRGISALRLTSGLPPVTLVPSGPSCSCREQDAHHQAKRRRTYFHGAANRATPSYVRPDIGDSLRLSAHPGPA